MILAISLTMASASGLFLILLAFPSTYPVLQNVFHPRRALTKPEDKRRFNVAASRAKDQLWLFQAQYEDPGFRHFVNYVKPPRISNGDVFTVKHICVTRVSPFFFSITLVSILKRCFKCLLFSVKWRFKLLCEFTYSYNMFYTQDISIFGSFLFHKVDKVFRNLSSSY
jgi:hypothetical protein